MEALEKKSQGTQFSIPYMVNFGIFYTKLWAFGPLPLLPYTCKTFHFSDLHKNFVFSLYVHMRNDANNFFLGGEGEQFLSFSSFLWLPSSFYVLFIFFSHIKNS